MASLPLELWESVLTNVDSSPDVLHAMQTCWLLYFSGIRILYEHVKWTHPQKSAHNLQAWHTLEIHNRDLLSSWFSLPRSLTLAQLGSRAVYLHNDPHFRDQRSEENHEVAVAPAYPLAPQYMGHCISRFKHLVSLHFSQSSINESVYLAVFALPLLRHLRIEHCSFPLIPLLNQERFASLPVETLFFQDVTSDPQAVDSITLLPPIFLATAGQLNTIEVEWRPEIAAFFARHSPFDSSLFAMSTQLRHFTLLMPLAEPLPDDPDELYLTLIAPLIQFLEITPSITHFTVLNQLPNFFLPISILPHLKSYTGPINLFNKLPRRDLDHLELTDNLSLDQLLILFDRLPIACPSLTSLSFICDSLVDVVSTMTACLRRLRLVELSIICRICTAPEAAARILNHFPFIRSLRLYTDAVHPSLLTSTGGQPRGDLPHARLSCRSSGPSEDALDEASLKQLVGSYKELKEIQLRRSKVWRRCFGNDWAGMELNVD